MHKVALSQLPAVRGQASSLTHPRQVRQLSAVPGMADPLSLLGTISRSYLLKDTAAATDPGLICSPNADPDAPLGSVSLSSSPVHLHSSPPLTCQTVGAGPARYPPISLRLLCLGTFLSLPPSRTRIVSRSRSVCFSACLTCSGRSYLLKCLLLTRSLCEEEDKGRCQTLLVLSAVQRTLSLFHLCQTLL